jgi:hypothetical protein
MGLFGGIAFLLLRAYQCFKLQQLVTAVSTSDLVNVAKELVNCAFESLREDNWTLGGPEISAAQHGVRFVGDEELAHATLRSFLMDCCTLSEFDLS